MKKFFDKFCNEWFTFSNFCKYLMFQWAGLAILYEAVLDDVLYHYGIWHPIWQIKENWAVTAELYKCPMVWIQSLLYFAIMFGSLLNERRINRNQSEKERVQVVTEPGSDVIY